MSTLDVVLFKGKPKKFGLLSMFDGLIKYFTDSEFTHVGLIVLDPYWIDPKLKGTYLWNSGTYAPGDAEDHKSKLGVQLDPFYEYVKNFEGEVYIRRIRLKKSIDLAKLATIHSSVHSTDYNTNVLDWVCGYFNVDREPYKEHRFWCSAFVCYVLELMGYIERHTNWDIIRPSFFADTRIGGFDDLLVDVKYDPLIQIK